ncbi:MAG: flagellar basal-body rod protein FlgF [Eubacteriales bacterium]|nr:flagellar basal-body rod protein FlgF [Eubacteriales bacterium]
MIRGLYTATTGMLTQEKRMDVVINNLANATTVGYKQDSLLSRSFDDLMIERMNDPSIVQRTADVGPLNTGIHIDEVITNFNVGSLQETKSNTDLALLGNAFFTVNTADGERYTRAGNFQVDADGFLTTAAGDRVLGEQGEINVGSTDFAVDLNGNVQANGQLIDRLQLVTVEDTTTMRKQGGNLYSLQEGVVQPAEQAQVRQGFIEMSNVDLSNQMVNMIEIQRSYEINQRMIKIMDEKLGKTVNDLGRV